MIIAIDPGTEESAVVHWDGRAISAAHIFPNGDCLDWLRNHTGTKVTVAVEMIASYGMPVGREVFETCLLIGRLQEIVSMHCFSMTWRLVYRRDVKLHHCQSARAKDANVRQALIDKYGPPGTKKRPGRTYGLKSHLWSAFAIATYVSETTP